MKYTILAVGTIQFLVLVPNASNNVPDTQSSSLEFHKKHLSDQNQAWELQKRLCNTSYFKVGGKYLIF